jgi:hypothetical protein
MIWPSTAVVIGNFTGNLRNPADGHPATAEQDITQSSSFSAETPVEYFTSADKSSFSTSYDESIYLPGYGSFSGDEGNYYNSEYYKPGIGPLGYYESDYWRQEDSSTDSYWGRHSWSFNLTGTNLSALDGFALPQAPWSIYGEMPNTREEPNVVEANGTLYLLGGENGSYSPNLTFHEEQSDGSWGTLNSPTPTTWYSTAATVRDTGTTSGEMIIFISDAYNPAIYSYNTIFDSWNSIGSYSTTNDLYDCFMWGDDLLYMILGSTIVGYQFSTDEFLDSIYLDSDFSHMSVITHGDYIYIVGQYLVSGGGIFNLDYVYSTRIQYYDGAWSALGFTADSERRWCPGLAIYNNRLYVFGGTTDGTHVISASIAAGPPSDWQSHSSMLYGGTYLEAVVRGEEILVFGCDEGTKIEVYRPEND